LQDSGIDELIKIGKPANIMESSNLLMRRGKNTARKLEKTS